MSRIGWLPAALVLTAATLCVALWWAASEQPRVVVQPSVPGALAGPPRLVEFQPDPTDARPAPVTGALESLTPQQPVPSDEPARSLHLLAHADDATRLAAADELAAHVPGEAEHGLLAAALSDPNPAVREQSLRALEDAEQVDVIEACTEALRHPDLWVQDAGETVLYRHADRGAAIAALAALCADPSREVRLRAADLLDEMNAGPLAWDELYEGPVLLAWASLANQDTPPDQFGDDR